MYVSDMYVQYQKQSVCNVRVLLIHTILETILKISSFNNICKCTFTDILILIGVAGSFSDGGQSVRPAKIQFFPANIFSCPRGAKFADSVLPNYRAKLLCPTVLPMGKHGR